jgi:hypothetical protein
VDFVALKANAPSFIRRGRIVVLFKASNAIILDHKDLARLIGSLRTFTVVGVPIFRLPSISMTFFAVFQLDGSPDDEDTRTLCTDIVRSAVSFARMRTGPLATGVSTGGSIGDREQEDLEGQEATTYLSSLWEHIGGGCEPIGASLRDCFVFGSGYGQKSVIEGAHSGEFVRTLQENIEWEKISVAAFGIGCTARICGPTNIPKSVFATKRAATVGLVAGRRSESFVVAGNKKYLNYQSSTSPAVAKMAPRACGDLEVGPVNLYSEAIHVSRSPQVRTHHYDFHHFLILGMSPDITTNRGGSSMLYPNGRRHLECVRAFEQWRQRPEGEMSALRKQHVGLRMEVCLVSREPRKIFESNRGLDILADAVRRPFFTHIDDICKIQKSSVIWERATNIVKYCNYALSALLQQSMKRILRPQEQIFLAMAEVVGRFVFSGRWLSATPLAMSTKMLDSFDQHGFVSFPAEYFDSSTFVYTGENWQVAWEKVVSLFELYAPRMIRNVTGRLFIGAIPRLQRRLFDVFDRAASSAWDARAAVHVMQEVLDTCLVPDIGARLMKCKQFNGILNRLEDVDIDTFVRRLLTAPDITNVIPGDCQWTINVPDRVVTQEQVAEKLFKGLSSGGYFKMHHLFPRAIQSLMLFSEELRNKHGMHCFENVRYLIQQAIKGCKYKRLPSPFQVTFMQTANLFCQFERITASIPTLPMGNGPKARLQRIKSALQQTNASSRVQRQIADDPEEIVLFCMLMQEDIRAISHETLSLCESESPIIHAAAVFLSIQLDWDISGNSLRALFMEAYRILVPYDEDSEDRLAGLRIQKTSPRARSLIRRYYSKTLQVPYHVAMDFWIRVLIPTERGPKQQIFQHREKAPQPCLQPTAHSFWRETRLDRILHIAATADPIESTAFQYSNISHL